MFNIEVSISVNGSEISLLQKIDYKIHSLDIINTPPGVPKTVRGTDTKTVADWLYELSQRAESITYNNVHMTSADVDKWRR